MHYLLCLPQTYNNEQQSTRITKAHYEHHRDRVSYLRQSFLVAQSFLENDLKSFAYTYPVPYEVSPKLH